MTATLLLKIETEYKSTVFLPHTQLDKNKINKVKLLKSRTPEFELFRIVFWFLESNVIVLNSEKFMLLDQSKAEQLVLQLRTLLAKYAQNEQIVQLISIQLQKLTQFLELQTPQNASQVQHELQELYEQFYEVEGSLNVIEYQINTVYYNIKDNTYHNYTFAQLIQTYIFGEPFDANDENTIDVKQLTEFVDRAVVESPGFMILSDIQQLNEVELSGKQYLRGNYHLCQQLAPVLSDAPLNEISLLRKKKQYTDILEEVQKLKEHCLVKQEQYYFAKQFIMEILGKEYDSSEGKQIPYSRSQSPMSSPKRRSFIEQDGNIDQDEQSQITTIEEYLEDLLKRLHAAPEFILFAQEGRLQGFNTHQPFTIVESMFQILTNNFLSHNQYKFGDLLTDIIIKGDLTLYLDEQLYEVITKCTITDVNNEAEPQHIILLANEYYTKYLLTESGDKYLRLSTDQRITEIVKTITKVFLYDEELSMYMADYSVLQENIISLVQQMEAYGVDLSEINLLFMIPEEEKHTISYKHNLMISLLNCYNELVVKDIYFDNFLIKDAGHVLDKQCITRNLEGEYYELQINKPDTMYVQYTLQMLLLFINFVRHPSGAMLAMVEDDLAELISNVQVLVNTEMVNQVVIDVDVGKIPSLFAQHFFFKTFGNHEVDCKRCQYIIQSPYLFNKLFSLNCLQYCAKTPEIQLFQILSQFIILAYNEEAGVFNIEYLQIQSLEKQLQDEAFFENQKNQTFQPLIDIKVVIKQYLEKPILKTIIKLIEMLIQTMKKINSPLYGVYFVLNKTSNFRQQLTDNLNNYQYQHICTRSTDVVFKADIQMLIHVNKNIDYLTFNEFYDKYSDFIVARNDIKHELQNLRQSTSDISSLHPLLIKSILIKDEVYILLPDDYDLKVIANLQPELHEVLKENKEIMSFFTKLVYDDENQDVYYHYPIQQSQNMVSQKLEYVNKQFDKFKAEIMKFTGLTFAFMDQNSININHLEQNLNGVVSGKFTESAIFIRIDYLLLFIANSGNVSLFSSKIQKDEERYLITYNAYKDEIINRTKYVQLNQFQIMTFLNCTIIPELDWQLIKNLQRFDDCVINTIGNKQVYFELSNLIGNIDYTNHTVTKNNLPGYRELMDTYVKYSEIPEDGESDSQKPVLVYFSANDANKLNIVQLEEGQYMLLNVASMFQDELEYRIVEKQSILHELVKCGDLEDKTIFVLDDNTVYDYLKILSTYALGDFASHDFMRLQFNDSLGDVVFKIAIQCYNNKKFTLDLKLWRKLLQTDVTSLIELYEVLASRFGALVDRSAIFQDSQIFFRDDSGDETGHVYGSYALALDTLCDRKRHLGAYKHGKLTETQFAQWATQLNANFGELALDSEAKISDYIQYLELVDFKNCFFTQNTAIQFTHRLAHTSIVSISKLMNLRQFIEGLYREGEERTYKAFYSTDIDVLKYIQTNYSILMFGHIQNHLTKFEYLQQSGKQYKACSEFDAIQQLLAGKAQESIESE